MASSEVTEKTMTENSQVEITSPQASASQQSKIILLAGCIAALLLWVAAAFWPEARGIMAATGALALLLGFALSRATSMLAQALQVEKPKDEGLEITLKALRDGLSALPTQLESGLASGLGRHAETLGAKLAVDLKRSATEVEAALGHAREWIKTQGEANATEREAQKTASAAEREAFIAATSQVSTQVASQLSQQLSAQLTSQFDKQMQAAIQGLAAQHEKSLAQSVAGLRQNLEAALNSLTEATQAHGLAVQKQTTASAEQAAALTTQGEALQATAEAQGAALQAIAETAQASLAQAAESIQQGQRENAQSVQVWRETLSTSAAAAAEKIGQLTQTALQEITNLVSQSQAALATQNQAAEGVAKLLADLGAETAKSQEALARFETSAQINQIELQGGVAMLNSALGNVLDRLEGQAQAGESHDAFLAKLEAALAAYQERSGDILTENALKTQEILLEALQALERRATVPVEGEGPLA